MRNVDIFADGSCLDNGSPSAKAGWSIVIVEGNNIVFEKFGKLRIGRQTNNRAELESTYIALNWIKLNGDKDAYYTIWSDSDTVVSGFNGSAGRNANRDIWEGVEELSQELLGRFTIKFIESHKTNSDQYQHKMNCYADKLAKQGANSLLIAPINIEEGMVI